MVTKLRSVFFAAAVLFGAGGCSGPSEEEVKKVDLADPAINPPEGGGPNAGDASKAGRP